MWRISEFENFCDMTNPMEILYKSEIFMRFRLATLEHQSYSLVRKLCLYYKLYVYDIEILKFLWMSFFILSHHYILTFSVDHNPIFTSRWNISMNFLQNLPSSHILLWSLLTVWYSHACRETKCLFRLCSSIVMTMCSQKYPKCTSFQNNLMLESSFSQWEGMVDLEIWLSWWLEVEWFSS